MIVPCPVRQHSDSPVGIGIPQAEHVNGCSLPPICSCEARMDLQRRQIVLSCYPQDALRRPSVRALPEHWTNVLGRRALRRYKPVLKCPPDRARSVLHAQLAIDVRQMEFDCVL